MDAGGGLRKLSEAAHAITDYIVGYYSALRPTNITVGYPQTNRKIDTGKTQRGGQFLLTTSVFLFLNKATPRYNVVGVGDDSFFCSQIKVVYGETDKCIGVH